MALEPKLHGYRYNIVLDTGIVMGIYNFFLKHICDIMDISKGGNSCSRGGFVSGWLMYFDYLGQPEHDSFINRVRICQP